MTEREFQQWRRLAQKKKYDVLEGLGWLFENVLNMYGVKGEMEEEDIDLHQLEQDVDAAEETAKILADLVMEAVKKEETDDE